MIKFEYITLLFNVRLRFIFLFLALITTFQISAQNKSTGTNHDFKVKAFHIDLRCEVMTIPALKKIAKQLSDIGVNTLIMEWEGTFPFSKHATLCNKYAYSPDDIKSFIAYCSKLGIDVIPLQNCFGHVEYILKHDRYYQLREDKKEVSQVCPLKEKENKKIFSEIFTEVASMHPSKYFHIGGDETYLLGYCKKCSEKVISDGKSKLFVDYIKMMCEIVMSLGKTPVLWADILLKYPEAVDQLPKDAIFIEWNYGWDKNKFGDVESLLNKGINFWGAPSIRSAPDNLYLTQWDKHFNNIKYFIPECRNVGYRGVVMTSWSTSGTYGFMYDNNWEVIETYPIRYVYPLSGFNILIAAYGEALKGTEPLNSQQFVINYAQKQFGLKPHEGELLWKILQTPQELIKNGKVGNGKSILDLKDEAITLQKQITELKPKSNKTEFEHLRLMMKIRVEYLKFKEIQSKYESSLFDISSVKNLISETKLLIKEAAKIDKKFSILNKDFLYDSEIKEINRLRNLSVQGLYENIKKIDSN